MAAELKALVSCTEEALKKIFETEPLLSDLPYDITADELRGEVSWTRPTLCCDPRPTTHDALIESCPIIEQIIVGHCWGIE